MDTMNIILLAGAVLLTVGGVVMYARGKYTRAYSLAVIVAGLGFVIQVVANTMGLEESHNLWPLIGRAISIAALAYLFWPGRQGRVRPGNAA